MITEQLQNRFNKMENTDTVFALRHLHLSVLPPPQRLDSLAVVQLTRFQHFSLKLHNPGRSSFHSSADLVLIVFAPASGV